MRLTIIKYIKNGFYIHFIHALIQHLSNNIYLSTTIAIKLYSSNYFYWYGDLHNYLPNPRYNWVKQFIRFTDTGHIVSFALIICPTFIPNFVPFFLPLAHNIHFLIMGGYWVGKLAFDMKDSDRIDTGKSTDIIEWHMDMCTFIHHSVPYILIYSHWQSNTMQFNNTILLYTYIWLYTWFIFIYLPWRIYTGDTVYSILDQKQTSITTIVGFIAFIHFMVFVSNMIGYFMCLIL